MTRHELPRRRRTPRLSDDDRDVLITFARGYLHEDFVAEHGDAAGAATAFMQDANETERADLAHALTTLADGHRGWTAAAIADLFTRDLGACWAPQSIDEVAALSALVRAGLS